MSTPSRECEPALVIIDPLLAMSRLIDQWSDWFFIKDAASRYTFVNEAAARALGLSPAEVIGKTDVDLFGADGAESGEIDQFVMVSGEQLTYERTHILGGRARNLSITKFPLMAGDGSAIGLLGVAHDMTDRRRMEQRLETMFGVTRALAERDDLRDVFPELLAAIGAGIGFDHGEAWHVTRHDAAMELAGNWSRNPEGCRALAGAARGQRCTRGNGLPGRTWASRRIEWYEEIDADRAFERRQEAEAAGLRTAVGIPIHGENGIVAVLLFFSAGVEPREAESLPLLEEVRLRIGEFADRAETVERLREAREQLQIRTLEEAFRERDDYFRGLIDLVSDIIIVLDESGMIGHVSSSIERVLGIGAEDVIGRRLSDLGDIMSLSALQEAVARVLQRPELVETAEALAHDRSGSPRLLEVMVRCAVTPTGTRFVIMSARDATEWRRADLERRQSEEKYRRIFEDSKDAILLVNADGDIVEINQAGLELIGFASRVQARQINVWNLLKEEDGRLIGIQRVADTGFIRDTPCRLERADGSVRRVIATLTAVRGDDGAIAGCHGVLRDVTEARRREQERVELEAKLRQSETLSAMGTLIAGIAHEVRNPLFGISASLDAMETRFDESSPLRRYSAMLRREIDRLSALMQDLLDYGRPRPLLLVPCPIDMVIRGAAEHCLSRSEAAGVTLDVRTPPALPPVLLDAPRVEQVFQNLIENAIQHTPRGGWVAIEARLAEEKGNAAVEVVVSDSGSGIRVEDLESIFEPFFTRRRGGTGLGLSIVRRIVDEHGGTIVASNRKEGGARFAVTLPSA